MPGKVYIKGFIKLYGKYLRIDVPELLQLFEESYEEPVEEYSEPEEEITADQPNLNMKYIYIALGVIVLLIAIWLLRPMFVNKATDESTNQNQNTQEVTVETDQTNTGIETNLEEIDNKTNQNSIDEEEILPDEKVVSGVDDNLVKDEENNGKLVLKLKVVDVGADEEKCWVSAFSDRKSSFRGTMKLGESKTITATEKINLTLGNAGVVEVYLNDKKIGILGSVGEIVKKDFTLEDL